MDSTLKTMVSIVAVAMIILFGGTIYEREVVVPQCIEDGYEVYLDGEEVDVDTIDIDMYTVSVDREKECIYLTKPSQRTGIIPIFLPMR